MAGHADHDSIRPGLTCLAAASALMPEAGVALVSNHNRIHSFGHQLLCDCMRSNPPVSHGLYHAH